jgi:hypothetical protein
MEIGALLALVNAAIALVEKIPTAIAWLKQSKELSPEDEAKLDARIAALRQAAHWQV